MGAPRPGFPVLHRHQHGLARRPRHHPALASLAARRASLAASRPLLSPKVLEKVGRSSMQGLGLDSRLSGVQLSGTHCPSGTAPGSGSGSSTLVMRAGVVDLLYTCTSPDNPYSRRPLSPLAVVHARPWPCLAAVCDACCPPATGPSTLLDALAPLLGLPLAALAPRHMQSRL